MMKSRPLSILANTGYATSILLCLFMILDIYILLSFQIFNFTTLSELKSLTATIPPLVQFYNENGELPQEVYAKKPYLVYVGHVLPALIWSIFVPLQFWKSFRNNNKKLHKFFGYLIFISSISLAVTPIFMFKHDLSFTFDLFYTKNVTVPQTSIFFIPWFVFTGVKSFYEIKFKKNINKHRIYVIRHISIGLSVAIMRILIGIYSVIHQSLHPEVTSYPVDTKKDFFANSSLVSLIIVLFTTESYLKFEKTKSYLKGKKKL